MQSTDDGEKGKNIYVVINTPTKFGLFCYTCTSFNDYAKEVYNLSIDMYMQYRSIFSTT